jgi:hypothetical protein
MVEQYLGTIVTKDIELNQTDQFDCCIIKFSSVYGNLILINFMPYRYTGYNKILFSLYLKLFEAELLHGARHQHDIIKTSEDF